VSRFVPLDAYAWVEKQIARRATLRELAFTAPWLLRHATAEEARRLRRSLDWPLRLLTSAATPRFARRERLVFGRSGFR
jgi:hypothetical protein